MKKLFSILLIIPLFLILCSCSNGTDKSGGSQSKEEVASNLIGTWENVYEVEEGDYQDTDDTTVTVKSVNTTYTFNEDGTYSEIISNIIDQNGTETSTNISETTGTYVTTSDTIRLSPEIINGMSKTDLIESTQNSQGSSSDLMINDPTFGFKATDITVTFDSDDTITLSGLPGGENLTFTKVTE